MDGNPTDRSRCHLPRITPIGMVMNDIKVLRLQTPYYSADNKHKALSCHPNHQRGKYQSSNNSSFNGCSKGKFKFPVPTASVA